MKNNNYNSNIITRFAPSPTGKLHVGGIRTALFNYLFTKKQKGLFILRIEDTDVERSNREFEKDIIESLKWLGIKWDKGPIFAAQNQKSKIKNQKYTSDYGLYRQSERLDIYAKYLKKLIKEDKAYYCFCSEEELEAQKQHQLSMGEAPRYLGKCSNLSEKEVQKKLSQEKSAVIRFRMLAGKIEFNDLIRGKLEFDVSLMGDTVIAKNINSPLYNFACVVDDFEMKISHVIRGEEHISNTPKQILLQKALNFPMVQYAHLPMILAPDRTKLSKRHGAVGVSEYRKEGYLPEALINFLAFLGWNPKDEREFFTLEELIKEFSIEKVQKSGAIFNIEKLNYINGYYIRKKSVLELTELCLPHLIESGFIILIDGQKYQKKNGEIIGIEYLQKIVSIYQERLKKISEISELTDYFFDNDKLKYQKEVFIWENMTYKEIVKSLKFTKELIYDKIKKEDFNKNKIKDLIIDNVLNFNRSINLPIKLEKNKGFILWPFRVALTAKKASSGPFEIAEVLGKEKTLERIDQAISFLEKNNS